MAVSPPFGKSLSGKCYKKTDYAAHYRQKRTDTQNYAFSHCAHLPPSYSSISSAMFSIAEIALPAEAMMSPISSSIDPAILIPPFN